MRSEDPSGAAAARQQEHNEPVRGNCGSLGSVKTETKRTLTC